MDNIVTIGSRPGEGASAPQPQSAPSQGLHVTEKAVARIRIAMAKEGVSPEEGGLRLGVTGGRMLGHVLCHESRYRSARARPRL